MIKRRSGSVTEGLCCCEYIDESDQRNHILACCCDCSAVDSACDRLLTCKRVPDATLNKMFSTIEDRLRIPWFNGKGAIKVDLDIALPVIIIPLGILIGTLHSALTIIVMVFMPLTLLTFHRIWLRQKWKKRTKLFYAWGVVSVIQMFLTFQLVVISYRKILLWENMLLITLIMLMLYAFYHAKKDPGIIRRTPSQEMLEKIDMLQMKNKNDDSCQSINEVSQSAFNSVNFAENKVDISNETENCHSHHGKVSSSNKDCCSNDGEVGPVGRLLMQNFGMTDDMIQECVNDKKKEHLELSNLIPSEIVNWVDSRMVPDGKVSRWCKICRLVKPPRTGHCPVCNACIQSRDHHCIWIDNCIGANNHRAFIAALILFLLAGTYGAHLSMTTICTPEIYWDWFLFPSDCRFLYSDFPTALCFVSTVYSICAVIGMSAVFLTQCLLISQNVTSHEMHTATFRRWIKYGVCVQHNSLNRGVLFNLFSFIKGRRKHPQEYEMLFDYECM